MKIRIFILQIFNRFSPTLSILCFGIFHLPIWSFPFLSPIFSILQTETSNYAYCHQHRAATKAIFPSFYRWQLRIWNWRKKLALSHSKRPWTCFLSCCLFPL